MLATAAFARVPRALGEPILESERPVVMGMGQMSSFLRAIGARKPDTPQSNRRPLSNFADLPCVGTVSGSVLRSQPFPASDSI